MTDELARVKRIGAELNAGFGADDMATLRRALLAAQRRELQHVRERDNLQRIINSHETALYDRRAQNAELLAAHEELRCEFIIATLGETPNDPMNYHCEWCEINWIDNPEEHAPDCPARPIRHIKP